MMSRVGFAILIYGLSWLGLKITTQKLTRRTEKNQESLKGNLGFALTQQLKL